MGRFFQQLRVLLWKNYTLKKRRPILFIIEILTPLVLCFVLGEVRRTKPPVVMTPSFHYATGLPSAGLIPFIQGLPVLGCWDYESFNVEQYPLPTWFAELPNIEKAYREVASWPLVYNESNANRLAFKKFAMDGIRLTDRQATALTVSRVDLTTGMSFMDILTKLNETNSASMSSLSQWEMMQIFLNSQFDLLFTKLLQQKSCDGRLEDILQFPTTKGSKLSQPEMGSLNAQLCSLHTDWNMAPQLAKFKAYTKPDEKEIQREMGVLGELMGKAFYPIPVGASAPVLRLYQKALKLNYRAVRTTLALLKYYLCPTLQSDMESFFIKLDKDMMEFEGKKKDAPTTPPLYPKDPNWNENESPQKPHRRNSGNNIFNKNKYEVERTLDSDGDEITVLESDIWYTITRGLIYYSPDTPLVRSIVKQANSTFEKAGDILKGTKALQTKIRTMLDTLEKEPIKKNFVLKALDNLAVFMGTTPPEDPLNTLAELAETLGKVENLPNYYKLDRWKGFANERDLELAGIAAQTSNETYFWAGISFENIDESIPEHIRYKIRMRSGYMPPLKSIRYLYWRTYPYDFLWDRQYWVYGFVYLQDMVESGLSAILGAVDLPGMYSQMFPFPCWLNDKYLFIIARTLPMCMVISWVYIVAISTKRIVYEKELRLKEVMSVMGLGDGVHWWAWGITLFLSSSVTNVLLVVILKLGKITIFSDALLLYLLLTLFTLCNIAACFLISVFFVQSKLASVVSAVAFYSMYIPYTIASLQEENMEFWMKVAASLSSTTAFGFGMLQVSRYEEQGVGLRWDNLAIDPDNFRTFTCYHIFSMLVFDFFLYIGLTLYFQQVLPGKDSVARQPWYFPLTWFCRTFLRRRPPPSPTLDQEEGLEVEAVGKHLQPGVQMTGLSKQYGTGNSPFALRNLSLTLYKGQVTSLLGHNGAGKTTTMSLITGMITPTTGSYTISNSAETSGTENRDSIGVCPQHNVLWDDLTIAEHLLFYGQLRGMHKKTVVKEMEDFIRSVDLPLEKRDSLVKTLSGGMKRKLSVAIAFLGSTRTLVLDEPTAGVDPKARRDIWDMIVNNKRNRTILLSTHHMEEAEVLGDRIAILSQGRLVCCGTSLFLKRLAGGRYFLTVQLSPGTPTEMPVSAVEAITGSVMVKGLSRDQLVLEMRTHDMGLFEELCVSLDNMKSAGHIESYGIRAPSMEDVFMKLSDPPSDPEEAANTTINPTSTKVHLSDVQLETIREEELPGSGMGRFVNGRLSNTEDTADDVAYNQLPKTPSTSPLVGGDPEALNTGWRLRWQQFRALYKKRWNYAKRDKKGVFAQVVLPALFIAAAMSINLAVPVQDSYKERVLSLSMFDYPNYVPFETRTPLNGVKRFDQRLMAGATYGDSYSGPAPRGPEEEFEECEAFPSEILRHADSWTLQREFVPMYPMCDISYQVPTRGSNGEPFPSQGFQTRSGDVFLNITGTNYTQYLMITQPEYILKRYVGFTFDDARTDLIPEYASAYTAHQATAKSWYLNKGYHAQPAGINAMRNMQLRNAGIQNQITVAAQAMNQTAEMTSHEYIRQGTPIVVSIFIIVGLSFVPTSFVVYLVAERRSNAKHLQFCAGISAEVYWLSNFVWDMCNFLVPTAVSLVVFYLFKQGAFVTELDAVLLLILIYGCAATPLFYPASFIFNIPSAAYVTLLCANLFVAVTTSYSVFVLERFPDDPALSQLASALDTLFLVFPPYCLGKGCVELTYRYVLKMVYQSMGIVIHGKLAESPWRWDFLGRYYFVLPLTSIFWIGVTIFIERYLQRRRTVVTLTASGEKGSGDAGIEAERANTSLTDILNVRGLSKRYQTYSTDWLWEKVKRRPTGRFTNHAVRGISFGVRKGECFGLLGINGAGKTSTFNMLTGATGVTAGDATVGGYSVVTQLPKVQQLLGYCPQFDALILSLTGREMLTLFASLHGVKDPEKSANHHINKLGIAKYADMQCYQYSGGNRRKLSAAIALVGSPEVLLLDEPTAGMDPGARRQLWEIIRQVKQSGTSVLLTSHSMGECEELCDRIAIMNAGKIQCCGTPHYLKEQYGSGYSATVKSASVGHVITRVEEELLCCRLVEQHHNMLIYAVPPHSELAPLFALLSLLKKEGLVEDYSVSQCSLEDVFINFARAGPDLDRTKSSDCRVDVMT